MITLSAEHKWKDLTRNGWSGRIILDIKCKGSRAESSQVSGTCVIWQTNQMGNADLAWHIDAFSYTLMRAYRRDGVCPSSMKDNLKALIITEKTKNLKTNLFLDHISLHNYLVAAPIDFTAKRIETKYRQRQVFRWYYAYLCQYEWIIEGD